ncbi:MAG: efflux transporter outer membrane subunit [Gemmatimonadaceae bacterium]|nr:efflux transporter outer membrane subunit [Gemmatimonadaceae bacterium]
MRFSKTFRVGAPAIAAVLAGCVAPKLPPEPVAPSVPTTYGVPGEGTRQSDTISVADMGWRQFFADTTLLGLIDTAVRNNPELLSTLQEVEMSRAELRGVRGQLFPRVSLGGGLGIDKAARYTAEGAGNASTDITEGKRVPDPIGDLSLGFTAAWEADVRGKIRNQKGAALQRYLGSIEGSRYVLTGLVAEVANTYYELTALDAKLAIVRQAIALQRNELDVVRAQREAAGVTELAVKQFEALLLNAQTIEVKLQQQIRETENRLNLLLGRYPQPVARPSALPSGLGMRTLAQGLPSQLLRNRPDIRAAELELKASRFDVKAARAEFLPEVNLTAGLGVRAFTANYLFQTPESMAYGLAGDLMAPLINRIGLKAEFQRASAAQQKALLGYRQSILSGVTEVSTLVTALDTYERGLQLKTQQAAALDSAVSVAGDLFNAARANYLEVLTAQREAIDVKLELVEAQLRQRVTLTNLYRALGGGWK